MANKSAFLESVLNGTYENKNTDWGKQKNTLPTPKQKTFTERLQSTGEEALQDITSYVKKRTNIKKRTESYIDKNLKTKTNKEQTDGGSAGGRMTVNTLDELYNAKGGLEEQIKKAPTKEKDGLIRIYNQVNKDIKTKESQGETKTPFLKKTAKTAVSARILLGKGVVKGAEGILDTAVNIGTSKYNPYYLFGNNANRLERDQQMAQEFIQKDSTQELMNMVGYDDKLSTGKTIQQTLDEASMLKSGTKEASIIEGVGQNVLSAFLGSELASGVPISNASKFATKATTAAKEIVETLPFAATSYGSSLEEAYNSGADRQLANEYAALNTALELGTEKIYTQIGSVLRTGGAIDDVFTRKITSKISNSLFRKMAQIGLGAVAEGGEEVVGALINPILKKLTYLNETDLKTLYENANILDAFIGGAIGGAVLGTASVAINDKTDLTNQSIKELNNIVKTSKNEKEVKLATKIIKNMQFNDNIKSVTDEQQQTTTPETIKPSAEQQTIQPSMITPETTKTPQEVVKINKQIDSRGKQIPNEIATKFRNSKIRDNKGNLEVVYHTSPNQFDVFDDTKIGTNTMYENSVFGHFVTANREFSERFGNIDNEDNKKTYTMELYANIKKPIIHPYNAHYKYSGKELDNIVIKYLKETNNGDFVDELKENATEDETTIYDEYMNMASDGEVYDSAETEKEILQSKGYDAVEFVEGTEKNLINGKKSNNPIVSYAIFDGKKIQNIAKIKQAPEPIKEEIKSVPQTQPQIRKASIREYRNLAQNFTETSFNWKDTPILQQRNQTMKRNLRDIVKEQSEEMYNEYFAPISKHQAEVNKFINSYNDKIKKLNLTTNEAIATQMVGELKYNPDTELTKEDVDSFISAKKVNIDKINTSVEFFRDTYDELIIKINDTLRKFGLKEIDYRKGYFPHFIDQHGKTVIGKIMEKLGWKFNDNKIPTDIAGITDMFSPNKKWTSFAQKRTGDLTEYNALKGFDSYIRGASHLIYHTEDIQKLNGLMNEIRYQHSDKGLQKDIDTIENNTNLTEEEKQSAIDSRYQNYDGDLANFVVNLKDYTDNLAGKKSSIDRGAESLAGRKIYNTIDNIMNRASGNMVGANIGSALTNFIPLTQAYSQISTVNMLKAVAQTISNQKNNDNFDAKSTYLSNRVNEADKLFKTGIEKASDISSFMFKGIDNAVSEIIVRGKYLENIKKGMDETKALNNADEFAKDVMAGRSLGDKPTIFNSKTNKLLTAFQLEVNNQYQYMFKDLPHDMQNEAKGKLLLAFLKMFVGAWVYNQLSEKITGRKPAFSPIDIIQETTDTVLNDNLSVYEKLAKTGKNLADELPFIGGLLGGGRIPISSAFPDVATTIEATSNLLDSSKSENVKKTSRANLAKELSKPLYYLIPPFGGGQTKKTIEGLSMFSKKNNVAGSYTASGKLRFPVNENIVSKAQAALFGQYSSENAKEYFNNNYSPLGEKQVQEYKDLNVDIKDYWKYREGLSKQKSVDEKFNYISNTDFTNKQKNILINNAVDRKEKVDISNYKDYQSYDEFSYATSNPSDYAISKQIASYDKFKDWSDKIAFRRETSDEDKKVTIKYINSLPLTVAQKALFIKKYYSSYDSYNDEIVKYINSKNISKFEKATILKRIGFNNYDDYLIKYVDAEKLTKDEKLNKLKEMGFTIKNGKVYK